ncbi:murein hydrolase activator EnvC family protein [Vibrio sonorensis]|uniref:murein hydrolase activator EnvC family protein n=1 Tax=Vibrio sonorensis TaxID=1004316 RepID=UPI0008D9552D|nr:murein hydrolase activator EnvC [Vibrio sonorensis]
MVCACFRKGSKIQKPLAILLALGLAWSSCVNADSKAELKGVKGEISRQQQSLTSQKKKLDDLQKSLKNQEMSISAINKDIRETKTELKRTNKNIGDLETRISVLEETRKLQSDKLEELLQTYYVTQRAKSSTNILNNGVEEDRISQYFQHLAKQRTQTIEALNKTKADLDHSREQLQLEKQQITRLLDQQNNKLNQLSKTRKDRKGTVGKIKKSISNDKVYLSELQRNETRLKAEIAKAAKRNNIPMDGLAKKKGRLPWPVKGKVMHSYGSNQTGQLSWKGIVIDANYGQAVKAVYSGTVVFADYLRGYGLVVLLDHGKGDMTLYGFNQSLMKKEGDKVASGETIALAGDTGGQPQASLYFEIRRNSKTQNPRHWLVR